MIHNHLQSHLPRICLAFEVAKGTTLLSQLWVLSGHSPGCNLVERLLHSLSALKIRGQKYSWTMCYVSLVSRYSLIKRGKPDKVVGRFRRLYKRKKREI